MKTIILIIKGFIIGIAKIIPGVSGAVLAISMGLYDKSINAITEFFSNPKKNFLFLSPIAIGVLFAMIIGSNILLSSLENHYLATMLFFIGLIIGSIPTIYKKTDKSKKGILIIIISFVIMFIISISNINNTYIEKNNPLDYLIYFISGLIEAIATVIPGISSTALLMIIGTYDIILETISNLLSIKDIINNIEIILCYSTAMLIGIIITSITINYLFKKYNQKTYSAIFGIILSTILLLLIKTFSIPIILQDLIIGITLLSLGIIISFYFES